MNDESQTERASFGPIGPWLESLLAAHRTGIDARGLRLRLELDPAFVTERSEALADALRELFRLILATVPDGCEVYLGGTRATAAVSNLGAGQWSARWQVTGAPDSRNPSKLARIHPLPGDAQRHRRSASATRVLAAFARTEWSFTLEALDEGRELLARGRRR